MTRSSNSPPAWRKFSSTLRRALSCATCSDALRGSSLSPRARAVPVALHPPTSLPAPPSHRGSSRCDLPPSCDLPSRCDLPSAARPTRASLRDGRAARRGEVSSDHLHPHPAASRGIQRPSAVSCRQQSTVATSDHPSSYELLRDPSPSSSEILLRAHPSSSFSKAITGHTWRIESSSQSRMSAAVGSDHRTSKLKLCGYIVSVNTFWEACAICKPHSSLRRAASRNFDAAPGVQLTCHQTHSEAISSSPHSIRAPT